MLYSFRSLQNAGNAISENLKFNIFQGACPRTLLEVCRDFGAHLPHLPPPRIKYCLFSPSLLNNYPERNTGLD